MIPVHGSTQDLIPDLAMLVVNELEAVERGIKVLARSIPLEESVVVDALALDVDRRVVLVLVDNELGDLHGRAADALVAYRRSRGLLARIFAQESFDDSADPRLMLIARRFTDRTEARCSLLPGAGTSLVEIAVIEGASGRQVLLLARGGERASKRSPSLRLISTAHAAITGVESATRSAAPETPPTAAVEAVAVPAPELPAAPAIAPHSAPEAEARDLDPAGWLEAMKARILRISPDVLEEQDGATLRFRFRSQLLVTLARQDEGVVVRFGDGDDGDVVVDRRSCAEALDNVFERFFNLAATRRRSGAKDGSAGRVSGRERPSDAVVAARMDV